MQKRKGVKRGVDKPGRAGGARIRLDGKGRKWRSEERRGGV